MLDERLQDLLEGGIDPDWFNTCDRHQLKGYLANLKAHRGRLDVVEANVIGAINHRDRQEFPRAKPSDTADDITSETGESRREANRKTRRAELFDRHPQVSAALAAGRITSGHADLLTSIPDKYTDALQLDLQALLETAESQTVDEFKDTVRDWKDQTAKDSGEDPHKQRRDRRSCSIRSDADGMVRLSALLDPESGAIVGNALNSECQRLFRQDQDNNETQSRSYGQRTADALTNICRAPGDGDHRTSREPTVVVTVGLEDLKAGLDGHKTRLATPNQRQALATQYDNSCAAPSCDRPIDHIHHIDHWENGGPTNLENLIPLCTRHHTLMHDGRLAVNRTNRQDHWQQSPQPRPPPTEQQDGLAKNLRLNVERARAASGS